MGTDLAESQRALPPLSLFLTHSLCAANRKKKANQMRCQHCNNNTKLDDNNSNDNNNTSNDGNRPKNIGANKAIT